MTTADRDAWATRVLDDLRADLDRRSLTYVSGTGGEILVPFEHRDGRRIGIAFVNGATPEHGLIAKGAPAPAVSREHWPALLFALNNWNASTIGPKAHLYADDWVNAETATVYIETWLPVPESGATDPAQLRAVVDAVFRACALFVLPDLLADARS